jgi:hypothetical protein
MSQDYPKTFPNLGDSPWQAIDFRTNPRDYLYTVLAYVLDGNTAVDWRVQENAKRKWYHVPWMDWDTHGREFVHGLTRERNGNSAEITGQGDPANGVRSQSWAVGFYNELGGYTIGQVWNNPQDPDPKASQFPEGTVVAKLLFTESATDVFPFLADTFLWKASIHKDIKCRRNPPLSNGDDPGGCERQVQDMRLLQLDVAVKDARAGKTQWVFGTFVYNGNLKADQSPLLPSGPPWNRLVPVGLMWGNDPTVVPNTFGSIQETRVLPTGLFQHLGCAGRLNGPIDNPISSCLSCHMTSQYPPANGLTPSRCDSSQSNMQFFRNLGPDEPFDKSVKDSVALDFSLQLAMGIRNFRLANPSTSTMKVDVRALQRSIEIINR